MGNYIESAQRIEECGGGQKREKIVDNLTVEGLKEGEKKKSKDCSLVCLTQVPILTVVQKR